MTTFTETMGDVESSTLPRFVKGSPVEYRKPLAMAKTSQDKEKKKMKSDKKMSDKKMSGSKNPFGKKSPTSGDRKMSSM